MTMDGKRIKCFNCNRIGHFSTECKVVLSNQDSNENQSRSGYQAHVEKEEKKVWRNL